MPTYVYETVPEKEGDAVRRYEIWQHMKDEPLKQHPETGERITRIIIGGLGLPGSIAYTPRRLPIIGKKSPLE